MIKENERGASLPSSGRAVASDFDNTLYFMGDEEPMRAADIFAIIYYQQRGGLFGLCTGRSLVGVREVIGPYIRPDFYILASGALVVDGEENVLFRKCLPIGIVKEIFEEYTPDMKAVIQANDTVYTFEEESHLKTHIDSFEDLSDGHVSVCAFHNVTHVDIAPLGCSKGTGIEVVREAFSVREMYGIGDSFNDLPLLKSVDHPYTLTHAPAELQEAAEGVVRGVSEPLDRI